MKNLFKENQTIKIMPENIEEASTAKIIALGNDGITVETDKTAVSAGEVEVFTVVEDGVIYFASKAKPISKDQLKITYPQQYKMLQRRKYSRLEYKKEILLKRENKEIRALITDISAGGMKLTSDSELQIDENYNIILYLDKNKTLPLTFAPIRSDMNENATYTVSGRFKMLSNLDRISLVQFCFKKQMENTNK